MENSQNKVINELQGWRQMEDQWKNLLGPEIIRQRYFMVERLRSLKDIHRKYAGERHLLSKDEKIALKMIKGEMRRMEKFLYPNRVVRLVLKSIELVRATTRTNANIKTDNWKPSISPIRIPKGGTENNSIPMKQNGNTASLFENKRSKNENKSPDRDVIRRQRVDDSGLLEKLRTGNSIGLRK